ncbi:hypothetical protein [Polynucleobacter necessarius]|uniref:hypothetical protein n=1 Tax=Polynucleobacter necessarius TaxID=576610 RepID=UPI000E094123|nr:hypothetical protein [Polynucleobacter necessarius]
MPLRLARQLIQKVNDDQLRLNGLYSREPFEYHWLISHQDEPLHTVFERFRNGLHPIESRNLFDAYQDENLVQANQSNYQKLAWLSAITTRFGGIFLVWRMQRKTNYIHKKPRA